MTYLAAKSFGLLDPWPLFVSLIRILCMLPICAHTIPSSVRYHAQLVFISSKFPIDVSMLPSIFQKVQRDHMEDQLLANASCLSWMCTYYRRALSFHGRWSTARTKGCVCLFYISGYTMNSHQPTPNQRVTRLTLLSPHDSLIQEYVL